MYTYIYIYIIHHTSLRIRRTTSARSIRTSVGGGRILLTGNLNRFNDI